MADNGMKKRKKYKLYKIEDLEKTNSLFDILFYLKMIGIILFAVFDSILDQLIALYDNIIKIFRGDWLEEAIKKYNAYMKKIGTLTKFKGFSNKTENKEIKEIRNQFFNEKEKELIFSNEDKKIA